MPKTSIPKFPNAAKLFAELTPKKKAKRRTKAEWVKRYESIPKRTATDEEVANQRGLFERHDAVVVSIRLPLPPSMNHYWLTRVIPGKNRAMTYISSEGQAYKEAVAIAWRKKNGWPPEPLTGRLRLLVSLSFRDRRECDLDNRVKPLQDALAGAVVFDNDSQIDDLRVLRGPIDTTGIGYCDVIIETIENF